MAKNKNKLEFTAGQAVLDQLRGKKINLKDPKIQALINAEVDKRIKQNIADFRENLERQLRKISRKLK